MYLYTYIDGSNAFKSENVTRIESENVMRTEIRCHYNSVTDPGIRQTFVYTSFLPLNN